MIIFIINRIEDKVNILIYLVTVQITLLQDQKLIPILLRNDKLMYYTIILYYYLFIFLTIPGNYSGLLYFPNTIFSEKCRAFIYVMQLY